MKTKIFDIYFLSGENQKFVKQGVSWPAFFFNAFWAFSHRMWVLGFFIISLDIVFLIVIFIVDSSNNQGIIFLMQIIYNSFIGAKANDWRRSYLEKKGFKKIGSTQQRN